MYSISILPSSCWYPVFVPGDYSFLIGSQDKILLFVPEMNAKFAGFQNECNHYINFFIMYVILVYDIGEKRVGKMLKLCCKYCFYLENLNRDVPEWN